MWATERNPAFSASAAAKDCVERMRKSNPIKSSVLESLSQFDTNSQKYRIAAAKDALHALTRTDFPNPGGLTDEQMLKLYEKQLAASGSVAYTRYLSLRLSGHGRRCTYCRQQVANTLDHFIPKKVISALAIEPWNLVPACGRCNGRLQARWGTKPDERMLHPYFMPPIGRWLYARIDNGAVGEPVVVRFLAQPDAERLGEELCNRVRFQFAALGLGALFGDLAIDELRPIQTTLLRLFDRKDDARAHLIEQAGIHLTSNGANCLRGVLYEALSKDDTFIENHLKGQPVRIG